MPNWQIKQLYFFAILCGPKATSSFPVRSHPAASYRGTGAATVPRPNRWSAT